MDTTAAGTSEYDRFGPWIDEVRLSEDIPRLFRDHPVDLGAARLVLKVPRNIARRDATADMDLYDHLLVLDDNGLTVLSRRTEHDHATRHAPGPGAFDVRDVPFEDVVAVRDVMNLLDGTLTLHTRTGSDLTVRYNGSGRSAMRALVDQLRARASEGYPRPMAFALLDSGAQHAGATPDLGREDASLLGDFQDVSRHLPGLTLWSGHGRRQVALRGAGPVKAIGHALSPATLHGAVIAGDSFALEVFGRHEWLMRGKKPMHSASRLVIPLNAPDTIEVAPHPDYLGVMVVTLSAGATRVELVVPEGSGAHRLLSEAAAQVAGLGA